jgi:hypothetical protein
MLKWTFCKSDGGEEFIQCSNCHEHTSGVSNKSVCGLIWGTVLCLCGWFEKNPEILSQDGQCLAKIWISTCRMWSSSAATSLWQSVWRHLLKCVLIGWTYFGGWQVITQPAHGPAIQITQVPVSSVAGKLPQSLHSVTPLQTAIAITTGATRTGKLKPDFRVCSWDCLPTISLIWRQWISHYIVQDIRFEKFFKHGFDSRKERCQRL